MQRGDFVTLRLERIPVRAQARELLEYARRLNDGPWVAHSIGVAEAAFRISEACGHMDPESAYVVGLLHDIGRYKGLTWMRHTIDGYRFLRERGFDDAARVALSHAFVLKDVREYMGKVDCGTDEVRFIESYLRSTEYDDYDLLIQLCDAMVLPEGPCLLEKRVVDVALRNGINDLTADNWRRRFEIKDYFDSKMGRSVYSLFADTIVDVTFGGALGRDYRCGKRVSP